MADYFYKHYNATLINDDVLTTHLVEPASVDLIVTAPPLYLDISYIMSGETDWMFFNFQWMYRALAWLKEDRLMCLNIPIQLDGQSIAADLTELAKQVGFQYETTLVWNTFRSVELILILSKPKQEQGTCGSKLSTPMPQLWNHFPLFDRPKNHPAPFAGALPRRCIKQFSEIGEVVLDPFMGVGTTILAALQNYRRAIGIDIDARYCKTARTQIVNHYR